MFESVVVTGVGTVVGLEVVLVNVLVVLSVSVPAIGSGTNGPGDLGPGGENGDGFVGFDPDMIMPLPA